MITLKVSWWELLTTGYLDPNVYKKGKGQATSQIEFRCKHEQTGQKSYTNSTLNITNGETVSHHYSHDRQAEKEMGSARKTAKTQKILRQAMAIPAEREEEGQYTRLMPRLELDYPMAYRNFIRMPLELFQELQQRLGPEIQREMTWMREPLSPGLKLAVTLRHLASGDSYPALQDAFRVARSTINKFVPEVFDAIIRAYRDEVMTCPTSPEDWLEVESIFRQRWNIPHALGALDGKHIPIRCPRRGGSLYHNYKGFHSIVLLSLVDGDYKFLWVDLGAAGSSSDAQIFKHSDLRYKKEDGSIRFPESESLDDEPKVTYFIIGDDAFPLKLWLMRPYSRRGMDLNQRVCNYRLSQGRSVV